MFNPRVVFGERAAVWSRAGVDDTEPRLRVLLPGQGTSVRDRARSAEFIPYIQQDRRRPRGRGGKLSDSRPFTDAVRGPRATGSGRALRLVLPGDPSELDRAWTSLRGHPGGGPADSARVQRLGGGKGAIESLAAVYDLQYWQRRVATLPPGPDLVAVLADRPDELAPGPGTDTGAAAVPSRWANAVLDSITARARVLSWLQAEQYTDLALLSANYPGLAEMLPTEIGFALRTSDATAGAAISTARALSMRLPATLEALRAGLIDADHAVGLARATGTTTAEVTAKVEADLLPLATAPGSTLTGEQLRRRAARRVITHDPDGARDRHRAAAADRYVSRWSEDDGMAGLRVLAPAQNIAVIWEALTGLADAGKFTGDTRTLGNRRVDALTNLCQDVLTGDVLFTAHSATFPATDWAEPAVTQPPSGSGTDSSADSEPAAPAQTPSTPTDLDTISRSDAVDDAAVAMVPVQTPSTGTDLDTISGNDAVDHTAVATVLAPLPAARPLALPLRHGRRPHIQVVVPYTVLLGANDPCELVGYGAITADQARMIAADGELRRILTDPVSGTVLDYGRTRYQPPASLKQFIIAREGTCYAPGCTQPADSGQIDHIKPYRPGQPTGGRTSHDNLAAPCHHHHRAKDGGGFAVTRTADGATTWTTPLGRHYQQPAHRSWDPADQTAPPKILRPKNNRPENMDREADPPPF
jgi:hypothetical protein